MIRRFAVSAIAGTALVLGAAAPANADTDPAELISRPAGEPARSSIVELFNTWMFCEETWLVSLDQMYPENFSVSQCMDVIETHDGHRG